jgi:hypothetical protein
MGATFTEDFWKVFEIILITGRDPMGLQKTFDCSAETERTVL